MKFIILITLLNLILSAVSFRRNKKHLRAFRNSSTQGGLSVQGGQVAMDQKYGFQDNGNHGIIGNGNGSRQVKTYVKFEKPFSSVPSVSMAISVLDSWGQTPGDSVRVTVEAVDVTKEGFNAQFGTWAGTHLWRVSAWWIAFAN